ncbi:PAS domain-containing sensor histidine kinase [Natrinema halophilum]|uniref:histidine kinase n=1 Tax=Natrinema halophilum TaxID=1699371 RepID=A0A7D5GSA2_9EURY|nr:PAS domain-containing sensor histidine kinase [Natrinema halophilum]QLG48566.1 PAS domain-containing sensor histidine kinase [Natrinema halophilum]
MDPKIDDLASVLLEHAHDTLAIVDEAGTYVYVNEASASMLGFEPDRLIDEYVIDFVHPDDRQTVADRFGRVSGVARASSTVHYRHVTRNDGWVWLESRFTNPPDDAIDGYVVSSRDISQRVMAERERRAAQCRLQTIAGTIGDVLWMFNGDWSELLFVNPAYEDVYGQSAETLEANPRTFLDMVHPDDVRSVREAMARASAGESVDLEYRVNPGTDYNRWVWVRAEPLLEDGDVVRIVGFSKDITDRRRRERQLTVMDNLLRHNLRNDLAVILGNAESIAEDASNPSRRRAEIIRQQGQELLQSADKQRKIIELLGDRTVRESIDIVTVVSDAVETIRDRHPNVTIHTNPNRPESAVACTVREIQGAVTELLENAVQHDPEGLPELGITLQLDRETVDVEIRDTCPPIPEVEFRVLTGEWEMNDVYHTSGLGLWLVYWTVDRSNGHIEFERSETGNTITVSLPRAPS